VDRLNVGADQRNRGLWARPTSSRIRVCWRIDIPRWKNLLYASLAA
jgi:hypothetical protein